MLWTIAAATPTYSLYSAFACQETTLSQGVEIQTWEPKKAVGLPGMRPSKGFLDNALGFGGGIRLDEEGQQAMECKAGGARLVCHQSASARRTRSEHFQDEGPPAAKNGSVILYLLGPAAVQ